ncbi:potassium transporter Kup [Microvirga sp. W0021]|uniref:Probable potassium transport system protein Kup n=1 Tax=Hohaiivirga grylli TaxID=3133970 RepID=A0ABV0BLY3_9HYPH
MTSVSEDAAAEFEEETGHAKTGFMALVIGSIGVVFGDIGTSPLYALKETAAAAAEGGPLTREIILGVLSLIVWALILVVTIKYVVILLKADNKGEGGTLTLVALAQRALGKRRGVVLLLGILGAGLFYGDSLLTPAISVLSAVEGLKLIAPDFSTYVVPLTIAIVILLFSFQRHGTGKVGIFFGPIMVLWFATLAVTGIINIVKDPTILFAISPHYSIMFFIEHPHLGVIVMGAVCLAVTGAEALYADLGHFGRSPIRTAWLCFIFPALVLNYFGQGALVLSNPKAIEHPIFFLVPEWALPAMIVLAMAATVIASQSVITGAFSMTRQAIQLGLLPRMEIQFTSESHQGQIFLPRVNILLMCGIIALILAFQSSSNLSHAYGISVFGAMSVDAILAIVVIWKGWRWSLGLTLAMMLPFLFLDLVFVGTNVPKIMTGGYVPIILGMVLITIMWTWVKGTTILFDKTRKSDVPLAELVAMLKKSPPHTVKGTAVFLTSDPDTSPSALLHNLKHNKVLHEKNVILTVKTVDTPRVRNSERVTLEQISDAFWRVKMTYGYMETPNIPRGLAILRKFGFKFDIMATSFFLSRRSIRPAVQSSMPLWQDRLYIGLAKSSTDATDFFQIPTGRVVEVGTQVTI